MSLTQKIQRYLIQLNTRSHGSAARLPAFRQAATVSSAKFMTKALPRIRAKPTREYDHDQKTMHWQGAGRTATSGDAVAPRRIQPGGDRREARRTPLRRLPRSPVDPRFQLPRGIPRRSGGVLHPDGKNDLQGRNRGSSTPDTPLAGTSIPEEAAASWKDILHAGRNDTSAERERGSEHLPSLALRASEPRGGWAISSRVQYSRIYDPKVDGYGPQIEL